MQLVMGAAVGAGVGAVVGAAATWKFAGDDETEKGDTDREKQPKQKQVSNLVPAATQKAMDDLFTTAKVAPDNCKQAVMDAVLRLFCLLAEVKRPQWSPDVLVQSDALHFRRDAKFAIDELLDTVITEASTPLYIEELTRQKASLLGHVETTGSLIIELSRQRITQNALRRGGVSS